MERKKPIRIDSEQLKRDFETAKAFLKSGDEEGLANWLGRDRHERAKKAAKRARS